MAENHAQGPAGRPPPELSQATPVPVVTTLSRAQPGLCKLLFCGGSFLAALCGTERTETIFLIPGSFLFFLSDKTGRPYVPPVYSYTHRYNKISLNIKEKTQRYTEYMCISNPN